MKRLFSRLIGSTLVGMVVAGCYAGLTALAATGAPAAPAKASTAAAPTVAAKPASQEIPQSVFTIPASPTEGRNPFFPDTAPGRDLVRPSPTNAVPTSSFVLNGISSPPVRTAIINNRTFVIGEEAEVKLPGGGKTLIKCAEIKDDSAVIVVNGQRRELKLRFGI